MILRAFTRISDRAWGGFRQRVGANCRMFGERVSVPRGILPESSDITEIISGGGIYVDKTDLIFRLMKTGGHVLAIAPPGFGKSVLTSTIKAIAENNLIINTLNVSKILPDDFKPSPVITLKLSNTGDRKNSLAVIINKELQVHSKFLRVNLINDDPVMNLYDILRMYTKEVSKPYVLIDDYDSPVWSTDRDLSISNHTVLRSLITTIESSSQFIEFCLISGVTKIDLTPINSVQSRLQDLKLLEKYSSLIGFSENDIKSNFSEYIKKLANSLNLTEEETLVQLGIWHGGYSFNNRTFSIYSPKLVINSLKEGIIDKSWRNMQLYDEKLKQLMVEYDNPYSNFGNFTEVIDFDNPSLKLYLWMKGYLTVEKWENQAFGQLKIANKSAAEELRMMECMILFGDNLNKAVELVKDLELLMREPKIHEMVKLFVQLVSLSTYKIHELVGFLKTAQKIFRVAGVPVQTQVKEFGNSQGLVLRLSGMEIDIDLKVGLDENKFFSNSAPKFDKSRKANYTFLCLNYNIQQKAIDLGRWITYKQNNENANANEIRVLAKIDGANCILEELTSETKKLSFYQKIASIFNSK